MKGKKKDEMLKPKMRHFSGKVTGWGYDTDGVNYWPPPCETAPLLQLADEANAIERLLQAVTADAHARMTQIEERHRHFWEKTLADCGLSAEEGWYFDKYNRCIKPTPKKDEKETGR